VKSLSSASRDDSGVPMAGDVWASLRAILRSFLAPATQRSRGISSYGQNSPESALLSTETRIKCFGAAALWKFCLYWSVVGPFSGLIRKAILKKVKTEAESSERIHAANSR
jgi:hypothetical protein